MTIKALKGEEHFMLLIMQFNQIVVRTFADSEEEMIDLINSWPVWWPDQDNCSYSVWRAYSMEYAL